MRRIQVSRWTGCGGPCTQQRSANPEEHTTIYPATHCSRGMFPPLDLPFKPWVRSRRSPMVESQSAGVDDRRGDTSHLIEDLHGSTQCRGVRLSFIFLVLIPR